MGNDVYYTWRDIEVTLFLNKNNWPQSWTNVEVYSDELYIYLDDEKSSKNESLQFLKQLYKNYYFEDENTIYIKSTDTKIYIYYRYEKSLKTVDYKPYPLFKDYTYIENSIEMNDNIMPLSGVKVVAFHSYKGGVGRTLSVISLAKEIIEEFNGSKKVLIIDSDIEAPGLTWLANEENVPHKISYLDILSIIHAKGCDESVIQNLSTIVEKSVLHFDTNKMTGTHYFIPTYRYETQILDIYSNPEKIMMSDENKYIIVDFLSKLGKELNVDLVLVDLRAGLSEYSAPFLLDPRVCKYLISSTSYQSAYGTNLILKQISKQKYKDNSNVQILLTMVPSNFETKARENVYNLLMELNENEALEEEKEDALTLTDYLTEIPISDALIHLGNLNHICNQLKMADLVSNEMKKIARFLLQNNLYTKEPMNRDKFLANLHKLTEAELTAEGSGVGTAKILTTKALEAIGFDYRREIPKLVVLGVKGSGKTYIYKQMLYAKTWGGFIQHLGQEDKLKNNVLIFPLISSQNRTKINSLLAECIQNCNKELSSITSNRSIQTKIVSKIKKYKEQEATESNWVDVWKSMILDIFDFKFKTLEEVDKYLEVEKKQIVFIIDGLEDIFKDYTSTQSEKNAISTLCIDIINILNELPYGNIGIVNFMRRDIAELSINTNYEQFKNQYYKYQLNWSQTDALRLALWLANSVSEENGESFYSNSEVPIKNASRELIEEALYKLWGKKMGADNSKTAFSARWVLASLSDFKGQLQARDIVRFLMNASQSSQREDGKQYEDRYLTPNKMKNAIKSCSVNKLIEIKSEIKQLEPIFDKLEKVNKRDKVVPLKQEVIDELTNEEKSTLGRYGYFIESDGEYYIPESIRFALDYNKTRRGGIKIVSLLVQK